MMMYKGQRFKNEFQFRRIVEAQAMRDGIKLLTMRSGDTSKFISCECSALRCDWKISAAIMPAHTCCQFSA